MTRSNYIGLALAAFLAFIALCISYSNARAQTQYTRVTCSSPNDTTCPPQCRKDLSYIYDTVKMDYMDLPMNTEGMWFGPPIIKLPTLKRIVIAKGLTLAQEKRARHHEACHEEMHRTTGNHMWEGH